MRSQPRYEDLRVLTPAIRQAVAELETLLLAHPSSAEAWLIITNRWEVVTTWLKEQMEE